MTAIIMKGEGIIEEVEHLETALVSYSRTEFRIGKHVIMLDDNEAFTLFKYLEARLGLDNE